MDHHDSCAATPLHSNVLDPDHLTDLLVSFGGRDDDMCAGCVSAAMRAATGALCLVLDAREAQFGERASTATLASKLLEFSLLEDDEVCHVSGFRGVCLAIAALLDAPLADSEAS